jgi:tryptophanyl-tRNA synthetase
VPVGEDQKQHLELTRDIAHKFNNDFKVDFFPLPEPLILGNATRVMSLRDGTKKMSKSDPSESSRINMTDGPDEIARKIRKAKTDPDVLPANPKGLENRPEAANLFAVFSALADKSVEEVCKRFEGAQFSKFKEDLTELAIEVLGPISMEMAKLVADPGYLDEVLADGSERARIIARPILDEVYDIVGLLRPKK